MHLDQALGQRRLITKIVNKMKESLGKDDPPLAEPVGDLTAKIDPYFRVKHPFLVSSQGMQSGTVEDDPETRSSAKYVSVVPSSDSSPSRISSSTSSELLLPTFSFATDDPKAQELRTGSPSPPPIRSENELSPSPSAAEINENKHPNFVIVDSVAQWIARRTSSMLNLYMVIRRLWVRVPPESTNFGSFYPKVIKVSNKS